MSVRACGAPSRSEHGPATESAHRELASSSYAHGQLMASLWGASLFNGVFQNPPAAGAVRNLKCGENQVKYGATFMGEVVKYILATLIFKADDQLKPRPFEDHLKP